MIGEMRHQIVIEKPSRVPDGMGGFSTTWAAAATVWAAVTPLNATERLENLRAGVSITHRLRMRFRADLTSSWRFLHAGQYYDIISPIDQGNNHRWLDVLCKVRI